MELWRKIKTNPSYEVSSFGRVRNKKGFIMKPTKTKDGYLRIELKRPRKKYLIHRLVMIAFGEECQIKKSDRPTVNHINRDKSDNCIDNLEWMNNLDNCRYSQSKEVFQFDLDGKYLRSFSCLKEAQDATNSDYRLISAVCLGKRKTHNGFIWKYERHSNIQ